MIKRVIRIGGFVGKEIVEIVRQPRLLLSLILGPFLIMLLFGIGYVGEQGKLNAILVLPSDPAYAQQGDTYRKQFGTGNLNVVDVTQDKDSAVNRLRNNEVDIVILVPADAAKQIGAGGQARLPVLYNAIDPVRSSSIVLLTLLYTNELNKETVAMAVQRSQGSAKDVNETLGRIDAALARAENNVAVGNRAQAAQDVRDAQGSATLVQVSFGLLAAVLDAPQVSGPVAPQSPAPAQNLSKGEESARNMNADMAALQQSLEDPNSDPAVVRQRIQKVRADIRELQGLTTQFASINPYVLAAPFFGEAQNVSSINEPNSRPSYSLYRLISGSDANVFTVFYTPGVLALLLQHIAITLASLSMVRERLLGSIELFRVSPITPGEILTGKYLGFGVFLSILSVVLMALVNIGLGVPILGDYWYLTLVVVLLVWASLGLGFVISMVSSTESQAVQIAMLTLLSSVFFSGFFLRLDTLVEPVRVLSYILPVTHGIIGLQEVMLYGTDPAPIYLGAMAGLGLIFAAFSMWRFGAEFRRG